jgi:hypothetical protein
LNIAPSGNTTNNGTFQANSGSTLFMNGTLTNYDPVTSTLTGGTYNAFSGTIQLSQANTGTGAVIATNAATILLDGASAKIADGSGNDILQNFFTTNTAAGHFTIQNGANLTTPGDLANAGAITIGANSALTTIGNYNQSGGITRLADSTSVLTAFGGSVNLSGGQLAGIGTLNGNVFNTGGVIAPGSAAPGIMTVVGDLHQGNGGAIQVDIGGAARGTQYDALDVNGEVFFGGALDFTLTGGFAPFDGEKFELLDYNSHVGQFASLVDHNVPSGDTFSQEYDSTKFFLVFHTGPSTGPSAVPEPSTLTLLGTGALGLAGWALRQRRRGARASEQA